MSVLFCSASGCVHGCEDVHEGPGAHRARVRPRRKLCRLNGYGSSRQVANFYLRLDLRLDQGQDALVKSLGDLDQSLWPASRRNDWLCTGTGSVGAKKVDAELTSLRSRPSEASRHSPRSARTEHGPCGLAAQQCAHGCILCTRHEKGGTARVGKAGCTQCTGPDTVPGAMQWRANRSTRDKSGSSPPRRLCTGKGKLATWRNRERGRATITRMILRHTRARAVSCKQVRRGGRCSRGGTVWERVRTAVTSTKRRWLTSCMPLSERLCAATAGGACELRARILSPTQASQARGGLLGGVALRTRAPSPLGASRRRHFLCTCPHRQRASATLAKLWFDAVL